MKAHFQKGIPIFIILLGIVLFFAFDLNHYLTLSALKTHHQELKTIIIKSPLLSFFTFMGIYICVAALSIPGATILTITGGYLFGPLLGTVSVVIGATLGASIIFLATKTAFHDLLRKRTIGFVHKFEKGFKKNAFSYLLSLRFIPIFPFWLVNIVPGLIGIRLKTFVMGTFIGIIPGTFIYVSLGNGLNHILAQNTSPNMRLIFEPEIFLPLLGFSLLSISYPLLKTYMRKKYAPYKN